MVSPEAGVVKRVRSGDAVFVGRVTRDLLAASDGTQRVADLLTACAHDPAVEDSEALGAIAELARLVATEMVVLSDEPRRSAVDLLGDRATHYPLNLQVELTAVCNSRCYYCYRGSRPGLAEDRLTTAQLLRILEDLASHGLQSVELTGGEPMLHEDFVEILRFCGERFTTVALLTNGTCLTDAIFETLRSFREKLVISISLDSADADLHDRRRGLRGAFASTTEAIRRLTADGFFVRVSTVVDEGNWDGIDRTMELAQRLGARLFAYTPLLPLGRGAKTFHDWARDPRAILEQERQLRSKYRGFLQLLSEESALDLEHPGGCGAGFRTYAMDPSGRIRPCVTFDADTAVFGSLRDESPRAVFGGPLAGAFAALTPPEPKGCSGCRYAMFCQGCSLRASIASAWVPPGECAWLRQPAPARWRELIRAAGGRTARPVPA